MMILQGMNNDKGDVYVNDNAIVAILLPAEDIETMLIVVCNIGVIAVHRKDLSYVLSNMKKLE